MKAAGLPLFLVSMACLWAFSAAVARRVARDSEDFVAIALLVLFTVLYAIPLAAGALGQLGPGALLVGSLATAIPTVLLTRGGPASGSVRLSPIAMGRGHRLWSAALALIALIEVLRHGRRFARLHPLSWDVAQFGLPNAIRFAQLGSLWPIDSPGFGLSYPYGYELSIIWPIVLTRSDSLLGLMHGLFCAAVMAYTYLLARRILHRAPPRTGALVCATIATSVLFSPGTRYVVDDVGKADVALAASGLAAVYFLLRALQGAGARYVILAGIALGLAAASKATGLAYVAAFLVVLALVSDRPASPPRRAALAVIRDQLAILGPALLVGGFWYARNWLVAGSPGGDPGLARIGWERSIARNLFRSTFYRLDGPFLVLATAWLAALAVAAIAVMRWRAGAADRVSFATLASALLSSAAIFCFTPFSAYATFPTAPLQLRLSGIMMPLLMIAAGIALARIAGSAPIASGPIDAAPSPLSPRVCGRALAAWLLSGLALLVGMGTQHLLYVAPDGLPGYDRVLGVFREPTLAYAWARRELHDRSVLSLYVTPYGLLGRDFSNRVVYDLHPDGLPIEQVRAAVQRFDVEYVFVGRNPNRAYETAGGFPPIAEAIAREPGFAEAFRDSQVVVYRTPLGAREADRTR